jgi:hypothetical protein
MAQQPGYSTALRTSRMTQVLNAFDAGSGAGILKVYDGTRPATGGAVTTLLATFNLGATPGTKPSGSVSNGVLTLANITDVTASGGSNTTHTWARITDSTGAFVADYNTGTSGADINFSTSTITAGQTIHINNGATLTEGNP